jgi:hypothetical protein
VTSLKIAEAEAEHFVCCNPPAEWQAFLDAEMLGVNGA